MRTQRNKTRRAFLAKINKQNRVLSGKHKQPRLTTEAVQSLASSHTQISHISQSQAAAL